ncbi:MAG: OmpA family protein [Deltaproteobacteria bacterium]|nr:OmpA family protein [Deltaproteobacteria bacterium]
MAGGGGADAVQRKKRGDASLQRKAIAGRDLGAALALQFKRSGAVTAPALQLRSANGVNVSGVRFAPSELPADGVTTSQASVNYSGRIQGGAKINWSIVGDAFGSSVSDTGLITPGNAITAGKDSVKLNVKAVDSKEAGAWDSAFITLWDTKFLQAKKDYPKFIAGTYSAAASVGKFDMKYSPRSHSATAEMKLEFKFFDDNPLNKKDKWTTASKAAYKRTFVSQAQAAWSGKFSINNVAEPKSIWGKLNPVAIRVKVTPVAAAGHFVVEAHRHLNQPHPSDASQWDNRAAVHNNSTLKIFQGDEKTDRRFMNADTIKGEQARVDRVNPGAIPFAADKHELAVTPALATFATYVKRVPRPRIAIVVAGHAGPGDTGTAGRKRSLSQRRAQSVVSYLRGQGVSQHPASAVGMGDTGALEARLTPTVDKNFRNDFSTIPHEFGHLLGLDDEYGPGAGAVNSGHSALVKDALGQDYADQVSKQDDDPTANIMHYGNQVRIHDYVTLWAALGDAAATAAVPAPPFTRADWKLNG